MPRIKFALFCYFSFFFSINYLNFTFRGQKKTVTVKRTLDIEKPYCWGKKMQNFLEVYRAIVSEYASSFHEKT